MITNNDITRMGIEVIIGNKLKVKRIGDGLYSIIGFNYGDEELLFYGYVDNVVDYLNSYFGYSE